MHTFVYLCGVYFICTTIEEIKDWAVDEVQKKRHEVEKQKHMEIQKKEGGKTVNGRHIGFERC